MTWPWLKIYKRPLYSGIRNKWSVCRVSLGMRASGCQGVRVSGCQGQEYDGKNKVKQ
jgi:hypothetical protein